MVAAVDRYAIVTTAQPPRPQSPVVRAVCARADKADQANTIHIDTSSFYGPKQVKLGIGSSAAVAVGAAVYLSGQVDQASFEHALQGHRDAAMGVGSGVDVAACFYGGIIATRNQPSTVCKLPPKIEGLSLGVFYLNRSVSTKDMVQACQKSDDWQTLTTQMGQVTRAGIDAWKLGKIDDFLEASSRYGLLMSRLGESAGVDVFTDEMHALYKTSKNHGAVAKPSGAGGGDVALVWSKNPEVLERIQSEVSSMRISIQFTETGARII